MNGDAANLDRLHDLALPPAVPWWPLASGWYWLAGVLFVLAAALLVRVWKHWKSNAYRREALRELSRVDDATGVARVLRRVALAVAPRDRVAQLTGDAWPAWLADQCPVAMPGEVRSQLAGGVYGHRSGGGLPGALRDYASQWVVAHRISDPEQPRGEKC